jgi:hypothetical protein
MSAQAGTTYGTRLRFQGLDLVIYAGSGSPEGVQTGSVGDWWVRADPGSADPCLYVKRSGTATTTGWIAVASGSTPLVVEAVTVSKVATASDSGAVYTNEGDTDGATLTLPTAVSGLTFSVYVHAAYTFRVAAASGDTVRIGADVTAAGGAVGSNTVGSALRLVAINDTEWVALAYNGDWTALAGATVQLSIDEAIEAAVVDATSQAGFIRTDTVAVGVADSTSRASDSQADAAAVGVVEQIIKTVL